MSIKEKLLSNIKSHILSGRLPEVIVEYRRLLMAYPTDVHSRQKLAEFLLKEERFEEAVVEYAVVSKGYAETGFYLKTIAIYHLMQKCEPDNPEHYIPLIELNEKQGLIGNALVSCEELIKLYDRLGDDGKVEETKDLLAQKMEEYESPLH